MRAQRAKERPTKSVQDTTGNIHPEGRKVEAVFVLDGVPEVVGSGYLPLGRDER